MTKFNATDFRKLRESLAISQRTYGLLYGFTKPQQRVSEIEHGEKAISNQVRMLALYLQELQKRKLLSTIIERVESEAGAEILRAQKSARQSLRA